MKLRTFSIIFFWFVCLTSAILVRAQITPDGLSEKVDELFSDIGTDMPGSAVVVVKDGMVLLNKGYGLANLEHQVPITPNTVFDLASVSKQFCGFAISTLIEQGKISVSDDVRKYIPELPDFGKTVTIDHLVHHISGIRDWTSTLPLAGWSFDDVISFEQILRMAYQQEALNFEPGSEYTYSNTGYNLLAEVVQRVTGQSFREWTNAHIFEPLNMPSTVFLDDHTLVIPNRSQGYYRGSDGQYQAKPNLLTALGSSSLYSTTADLARWVINLDNPTVGGKSVIDRMYTQGVLNNGEEISYAFGLSISDYRNTRRISHGGSWAMYRTHITYFPEYHLSVVVLNNYPSNPGGKALEIANLFIPDPDEEIAAVPPGEKKEFTVAETRLESYTGTYKLGPGWYVTISRHGNQLWTRATNENSFPMTVESTTRFRIPAYGNRTMEFKTDESGKVIALEYADMNCPRMENTDHSPSDLTAYEGTYVSKELSTEYTIKAENDTLKMWHHRLGSIDLSHAWGEDFGGSYWFVRSVEFIRSESGEVTGLQVTGGTRARNQKFVKIK